MVDAPGTDMVDQAPEAPRRRPADYCAALKSAEKAYQEWHDFAQRVEEQYANLERLAASNSDREFQLFWANMEVTKPAIYAKAPEPAVTPKFAQRKSELRSAAELLERTISAAYDQTNLDTVLINVRDDLLLCGRGAVWIRYEEDEAGERVVVEHVDRLDFRHEPARKWGEVGWVARRSYVTREEARARFEEASGELWLRLQYGKKEHRGTVEKAEVWEIWDKVENAVVWVAEGVDEFLDIQEPWLDLETFWPVPCPVYGTTQPRTLIPVPDVAFYLDQLREINVLTERISALAQALKMRGFVPGGANDLSEAVRSALENNNSAAVVVPVSDYSALGGASLRESIVWMPLQEVAQAISSCVELRRQVIDDVYQIAGISDILRGATNPNETLGAQQLKSQWGGVRLRNRQQDMARFARDITRIIGEIASENFRPETFEAMAQPDIPTQQEMSQRLAGMQQQLMQMQQQMQQAMADPQVQAQAQQDPQAAQEQMQQAQEAMAQLQAQMDEARQEPTFEGVLRIIADQRTRPFVLDIETDSTLEPDEQAEKAARSEFLTAMGGWMAQVVPLMIQLPESGPMVAESIRFAAGAFRGARKLQEEIDRFAAQIAEGNLPSQADQQSDAKADAEAQKVQIEAQMAAQKGQVEIMKMQQEMQLAAERHQAEVQKTLAEAAKIRAEAVDRAAAPPVDERETEPANDPNL